MLGAREGFERVAAHVPEPRELRVTELHMDRTSSGSLSWVRSARDHLAGYDKLGMTESDDDDEW